MTVEFCTEYDDRETLNKLSEAIDDPELRERINHLAMNYEMALGENSRLREVMKVAEINLIELREWIRKAYKAYPNLDIDIENLE